MKTVIKNYPNASIFVLAILLFATALSVQQETSVACSTQIALEWDEAFKNMNDSSGRAGVNVYADAY